MKELKKIFAKLEKENKAIGHFNVSNLESFEAVISAAKKTKTPIIIGVSEGAIKHAGLDFFLWAKKYFQKKYGSTFFLHLDHGSDLKLIENCINGGFDSVMIDASKKTFEENVYLTKYIVRLAHRKGVWVEAELGTIGGKEENINNRKIVFTDPLQAEEFVKKTGCDSLAISIGTSHGQNKFLKKAELNFDVLVKVKHLVDIPLVLHGASSVDKKITSALKKEGVKIGNPIGLDDNNLSKAVKLGIRKVNSDTDLNLVGILEFLKVSKEKDQDLKIYKILEKSGQSITDEVIRKIKVLSK